MALSDAMVRMVRQAKATGKDYTLGDSDGLSLGVTATGGKSWHFRYSWAGKQKRMSFGTYPEVGLRQARSLRDEARRLIAEGTNPCLHRRHQRHTQNLAEQNTFQTGASKHDSTAYLVVSSMASTLGLAMLFSINWAGLSAVTGALSQPRQP